MTAGLEAQHGSIHFNTVTTPHMGRSSPGACQRGSEGCNEGSRSRGAALMVTTCLLGHVTRSDQSGAFGKAVQVQVASRKQFTGLSENVHVEE